jgi:hypothetical protein
MTTDGSEQRTFIPDDDSASKANWPAPKPAQTPARDKAPVSEWLPWAIVLLCALAVVIGGLA